MAGGGILRDDAERPHGAIERTAGGARGSFTATPGDRQGEQQSKEDDCRGRFHNGNSIMLCSARSKAQAYPGGQLMADCSKQNRRNSLVAAVDSAR